MAAEKFLQLDATYNSIPENQVIQKKMLKGKEVDLSEYAKKSELPEGVDLSPYAKKTDIPTKTSQLTNDSNFTTKTEVANAYLPKTKETELLEKIRQAEAKIPTKVGQLTNDKGYLVKYDLNEYAKKSELPEGVDLSPYAKKTDIPTKNSQLANDKGYLVKADLSEYAKKSELPDGVDLSPYAKKSELPTKTSQLSNDSGFLTQHQSLADYVKKTDLSNYATKTDIAKLNNIDTELKEDSDNLVTNRAITKVIIENEKVFAATANDLNIRVNQKSEIGHKHIPQDFVTTLGLDADTVDKFHLEQITNEKYEYLKTNSRLDDKTIYFVVN